MLYIIIPVYNRCEFTRTCLLSLKKQTFSDFKVIVIDDGSTDGTCQMINEEFPEVTQLHTHGNVYWTGTVNLGIRHALSEGATRIMTLNNDTIAPNVFVQNMILWSERKPNTLLGALELDAISKKTVYGGETINWFWHTTRNLLDGLSEDLQQGIHKVPYYWGRGLLIPRKVFTTVGLFPEKIFPHYYADCDFTFMAGKKGFAVYCNYDAPLYTYPMESGQILNRTKKNLKNYYKHLFHIKGGGNLRDFTFYAFRNCPGWSLPTHLLFGYIRRIGGYLIK